MLDLPKIFISYRRADTQASAGRLHDALAARFGEDNVFMDVEALAPGADFEDAITTSVAASDVLLALIGRCWGDEEGLGRLQNADDLVRRELEAAFAAGVAVIPVLIEEAEMPGAETLPESIGRIVRLHALVMRHTTWSSDLACLAEAVEAAPAVTSANLPVPVSSFLGREPELAAAAELLASSRLLTVRGPGGIGKTRFAIELARQVQGRFPDGVFWVPLAETDDPRLVLETTAQAVGAQDGLADHIRDSHMLLVLDNLELVASMVACDMGDPAAGKTYASEGLSQARAVKDDLSICNALNNLGEAEYLLGEFDQAEIHLRELAEVAEALGQPHKVALATGNLGTLMDARGKHAEARALLERSRKIYEQTGDVLNQGQTDCLLGWTLVGLGETNGAEERFLEGLELAEHVQYRRLTGECLQGLAVVSASSSRPLQAATLAGVAAALQEVHGFSLDPETRRRADEALATVEVQLGSEVFREFVTRGRALPAVPAEIRTLLDSTAPITAETP